MDIKQIITENLPEGAELGEKTINLIAKEIKRAQGEEFIPKTEHRKKLDRITELEGQLADEGSSGEDAEYYKGLWESEKQAHKDTKAAYETKAVADAKKAALKRHLIAEGASEKSAALLSAQFDLEALEVEGEGETAAIKDWPTKLEPVKAGFAEYFGTVQEQGVPVGQSPVGTNSQGATPKKPAEEIKDLNSHRIAL